MFWLQSNDWQNKGIYPSVREYDYLHNREEWKLMSKSNTSITAALCFLRDDLRRQGRDILDPALAALELANEKAKTARIISSQFNKRAQKVQELITVQMQSELDEEIKLEEDYKYKSNDAVMREQVINLQQRLCQCISKDKCSCARRVAG
jgi:hypothetical protein